jgi:hypothetical protein
MSKTTKATRYDAVISQELGNSKNGGEMITLTFLNLETREESRSYIDETMTNFMQWAEIITQPQKGFIIQDLKEKRSYGRYNHTILNADCVPVVAAEFPDVKKMENQIRKMWAKEDFLATPYGKLFE